MGEYYKILGKSKFKMADVEIMGGHPWVEIDYVKDSLMLAVSFDGSRKYQEFCWKR